MLFLDNPVVVDAVPAKVFPVLWIYSLTIGASYPKGEGNLSIEIVPMSEDRELHFPSIEHLTTDQLYRAMAEVPELQQAFVAILAAVKPLKAWIEAQQKEVLDVDN